MRVIDIETGEIIEKPEAAPIDQRMEPPPQQPQLSGDAYEAERQRLLSEMAKETGPLESLAISTGRGMKTVARGITRPLGLIEPEDEYTAEAFKALQTERPVSTFIGEAVGESVPFLVGGLAGVPAKLAPRIAAAFGLGAAEGAIVAAGKGGDFEKMLASGGVGGSFAAASELALPVFGRVLGKAIRKITGRDIPINPDGTIPPDVAELLQKAGINESDLMTETTQILRQSAETPDGLRRLKEGLAAGEDIEQTARASLFEDLGIPTVRSRIEQSNEAFSRERTLARQIDEPTATQLRERLAAESEGFQTVTNKLIDDLGLPDEAGNSIKKAVSAREAAEKDKVRAAYDEIKRMSEGRGIPLAGVEILDSLKDGKTREMAGRLQQSEIDDLNDRLIEYGLDTNDDRIKKWIDSREKKAGMLPTKTEITPLNVLNYLDFRESLNNLIGPDSSSELRYVAKSLKMGLDKEIEILEKTLSKGWLGQTGRIAKDVIKASKRAVEAHKKFKSEFGEDKIVKLLTKKKRNSFDEPQILASEVVRRMLSGRGELGSPEGIEAITSTLAKSGKEGTQALGDLQAATALGMLEKAIGARSGKMDGGTIKWSGVKFGDAFTKIGERRLSAIFRNNPKGLKMLQKLRAAGDLTTEFATVAKSSGTSDDLVNAFLRMPILRGLLGAGGVEAAIVGAVADKGVKEYKTKALRKKLKESLKTSPVARQRLQFLRSAYPAFMAAIGIESVTSEQE
jgi:hypothetical protein